MLVPVLLLALSQTATSSAAVHDPDTDLPLGALTPRAETEAPDASRLTFRAALGTEWDTNAPRAIQADTVIREASRPLTAVSDGLVRLLANASGDFDFSDAHGLRFGYTLGAKRFFSEETEDLIAHDLSVSSLHRITGAFALGVFGTFRASRIRNGQRDYDLGHGGLRLNIRLARPLSLELRAAARGFHFDNAPRFDFVGPRPGLGVTYRPIPRLSFFASFDYIRRFYFEDALVASQSGPALCDGADCEPRRDHELQPAAGVRYQGPFFVSARYLLRVQRSNSVNEDIDRHRISVFATFALPWSVKLNVLAALQINEGVSITDSKGLAGADEDQNSVRVQLRRAITDTVGLETRYALYANQFTTAEVDFIRHTVYLGVFVRAGILGS